MDKVVINLVWLYPDILNLHGERGSVQAFQRVCENLGITINIKRVNEYSEKIDFKNTDIIFCPPGELKVIYDIKEAISKQMDELKEYIDARKYFITIGTTGCLLAKETIRENGEKIEGLGIFDMTCKERKTVIGDDLHFVIEKTKQEIIGSQIQMIDYELNNQEPLGTIIYGYGNNNTSKEGARVKNVIFTNCLGPVFVKNPWWAENIVMNVALNKMNIYNENEYELENKSFTSTKKFIKEKPKQI